MAQTVREVMTENLVTLPGSAPLADAARQMKDAGILSIGDLAIERDETSAVADISAADGNN